MINSCITLPLLLFLLQLVSGTYGQGSKCTPPYVSIDSKCYYFSSEKASWNKAYVNCIQKGGYLANLETLDEYLFVHNKLQEMNNGLFYAIGARDFNQDLKGGDWRWARKGFNSRLSYFAFGASEPDGTKTNPELCLGLDPKKHYEFVDIPCSTAFRYICEK